MNHRIAEARRAWGALKDIWKKRHISSEAKVGMYYLQTLYTHLRYSSNPDLIVNNHGKVIIEMSKTLGIVPINHLIMGSLRASGGLTFR